MPMKVVLASNNSGKIRELQALVQTVDVEIVSQADLGITEAEETGLTFVENALIKARHAASASGLPAIADDSGLVVAALNGAPGIYSARYAGKNANANDNIEKLLSELKSIPDGQRVAYFYCALVFLSHVDDPTPLICTGSWYGEILREPRGAAGFGYDPIFYVPSEKKAAAELPLAVKNKISHRGLALQSLIKKLSEKI